MKFSVKDAGGIKVVRLEGDLDASTSPEAQQGIAAVIDQGAVKVLVNLEMLNYMSSAGLRVLMAAAKKLKDAGGELRVCSLNDTVGEVFDISGFSTIIGVARNEEEALNAF